MPEVYSHCRGCAGSCGLIFEVEHERIVAHRANPDSLVSAGYKCIKGDMSVEFLNGAEHRYVDCQKRDASGALAPIAAEQLMDEVAEVIARGVRDHGPRSVGLYLGTGGYRKSFNVATARQLMHAIGSPSWFSTMTIDQSAHWVVDGRMGTFIPGRPYFEDIDVAVVTGANPVVSHSSSFLPVPIIHQVRRIQALKARGGTLIVVDPRKTETARWADMHIQPRPGFDTEIFACINNVILSNGWQDKAFVERFVAHVDALRKAVAPYTPQVVAERAGVSAEQLIEAARIISAAKKPWAGFGTGTAMSPNPNTAGHMIETVNALCGGFSRAGDIIRNPGVFTKRGTAEGVRPPVRSWESEPKLGSGYGALYGEFPTSRLMDEILTPGPDMIRTLIVLGANPVMAFGQPERAREAMAALECLVCIEPRATETTEFADYIVAPPMMYEAPDVNFANAGRTERPIVQYTDAVARPPPGVLNEWEFFTGLANRLGHTLRAVPGSMGFNPALAASAKPILPGKGWTTERLIDEVLSTVGLSIEELRRHPHGLLIEKPEQRVAPAESDDGARLDVCPPDVAEELASIIAAPAAPQGYSLVPRRIVETMNSEFRFGEATQRRFDGAAPIHVHPQDMAAEGFAAGELISILGEHGRLAARVRPDPTLRRGVISMSHCWSGDPEHDPLGHTSQLVSMREEHVQRIDGMPQQSGIPVKLARATASEGVRRGV